MTGEVILDSVGDREPDYWITDMAPNGTFIKVVEILNIGWNKRVSLCLSLHMFRTLLHHAVYLGASRMRRKHRLTLNKTTAHCLISCRGGILKEINVLVPERGR